MARHFPDWLSAYVQYAGFSEAPVRMHFWSGVSAIAGALRRRVWIDMGYFKWLSNMYIVFVAPPGVVAKSTTINIGQDLLRQVPDVRFGPDVVTWQALVTAFAEATESFEYNGDWHPMSALTIGAEEFGNLVDPSDRQMIDLYVRLWDGKPLKKVTKGSGTDMVDNPWINLIGCTTPAWIAGSFPEYIIGGGFTSRCLFVYAEEKEKLVAYPKKILPADHYVVRTQLIEDLKEISQIIGEYVLTPVAEEWGEVWYDFHWKNKPANLDDERFRGYLARKQTHIHKTAMILAAARHSNLVIDEDDLKLASDMVKDLEQDMGKIYSGIGRTQGSIHAERMIKYIRKRGLVTFAEVYQYVHSAFPDIRGFEGVIAGALKAQLIEQIHQGGVVYLKPKTPVL